MSNLTIRSTSELQPIIPTGTDKKELFNLIQESEPIASLVGKKFKINGVIPETVRVPKGNRVDRETGEYIETADIPDDELVERMKLTLITDKGVYHSFSSTFAAALIKAINIFGDTWQKETYTITLKMRGSGDGAKAYYTVTVH